MNRRIKLRHLEAFVAIARAKSLKRAAGQLNLTQPAISKTLRDLEDILGVVLMERDRGGVRLTGEGEVFLRAAEQSLTALQNGLSSLETLGEGGNATLAIGALPSVAAHLLPRAAMRFRKLSQGAVIQAHEGPHAHLTEGLRTGLLDLVVGRLGAPETMRGLSFTQLYAEEVVVVAAPSHPLREATQLSEIKDYPVIYPPQGSAIRPLVARQMIASGLPLFANRIESASSGFGRALTLGPEQALWFISRGVVVGDLATGRLVRLPIDMPATAGPVGIMARSEEPAGPTAHLFRQCLIEAAKEEGLATDR